MKKCLQRLPDLMEEIKDFQKSRNKHYAKLYYNFWLMNFAFPTVLTRKLNSLNLELQGEGLNIAQMIN